MERVKYSCPDAVQTNKSRRFRYILRTHYMIPEEAVCAEHRLISEEIFYSVNAGRDLAVPDLFLRIFQFLLLPLECVT